MAVTEKGNKMRTKAVREHFGKEDESSTITLTQVNAIIYTIDSKATAGQLMDVVQQVKLNETPVIGEDMRYPEDAVITVGQLEWILTQIEEGEKHAKQE